MYPTPSRVRSVRQSHLVAPVTALAAGLHLAAVLVVVMVAASVVVAAVAAVGGMTLPCPCPLHPLRQLTLRH